MSDFQDGIVWSSYPTSLYSCMRYVNVSCSFLSFSENRKLGESVRCLREQGLTFSQISQELKVYINSILFDVKSRR